MKIKYSYALVLGCWAGLFWPAPARAVTMDEFLNYSVQDLQDRMRDLAQANNDFRQKGDALRSRILFLRQEMRNLDNRKIELQEAAVKKKDALKFDSTEFAVDKSRVKPLKTHSQNLRLEQQMIQEEIARAQNKQEQLQAKADQAQKGLAEIKDKSGKKKIDFTNRLVQERNRFQRLLAMEQEKISKSEEQIRNQQKQLSSANKERDALIQAGITLRNRLVTAQKIQQQAADQESHSRESFAQAQDIKTGTFKSANQEYMAVEEYAAKLKESIQAYQQAAEQFRDAGEQPYENLIQLKQFLAEQQQLLTSQKRLAQSALELIRDSLSVRQNYPDKDLVARVNTQNQNLRKEQQSIKDLITRSQNKQQQLQEQSQTAKKDLAASKEKFGKNRVDSSKRLAQKRDQFRQQLAAEKDKISEADEQIRRMQKQLSTANKEKDVLTQTGMTLRNRLAMVQKVQQQAAGQEKQSQEALAKMQDKKTNLVGNAEQENAALQEYVTQLSETIQAYQKAGEKFRDSSEQPYTDLVELKKSLAEQQQLFMSQQRLAQNALERMQKGRNVLPKSPKDSAENAQHLSEQIQRVKVQMQSVKGKIGEQQKKQQAFADEGKMLTDELKGLQAKLVVAKKETRLTQDLGTRKTALREQIAQQLKQNVDVKNSFDQSQRKLTQTIAQRDQLKVQRDALEAQWTKVKAELKKNEQDILELKEQQAKVKGSQKQGGEQAQEENADLEGQRDALATSLAVVQTRYNTQIAAIKDFQKEEVQLNEYMTGLKSENQNLKQKEQELLAALRQLQIQ